MPGPPPQALLDALTDRYRIERELGTGGMASVYLAHDLRHDRDVAIKVLHPDLAAALGGERFLSEIKTTARLQHPHILPLLDSGDANGMLYYVMPYSPGETLRSRLNRERQLPIDDAMRITREVADALNEAHAHGIVHRDIKPENILLQGGHAVVADFGIALAVQTAGTERMTQTGLSLGTPQYMSPEQAMGERTVDARSDIYSLATIAYEMLVGEPPFSGPTVQSIVAKILTEKPIAPTAVRDTVPKAAEQAIMKALSKLPADRFATAEKFADALTRADVVSGAMPSAQPVAPGATTPAHRSRVMPAAITAALLLTAGASWWLGRRSAATAGQSWTQFTQLTDAAGVETSPSLSPDGEFFAYSSNARGTYDIYVQRVGGRNPVLVAGDTADEIWPVYSPDGRQIAYNHDGGGIFVVGATGESARRLTTYGSNASWSPDGKQIVFGSEQVNSAYNVNGDGRLWVVDLAGGEPRPVGRSEYGGRYQPAWSPSGERIAFWSNKGGQRDIETSLLDGTGRAAVTLDAAVDFAPAWSPDGKYLYFASDRGGTMGIWRIPVNEHAGIATGPAEPIAAGVDAAMDLPRLSKSGDALIFRSKIESVNPASIAFDPTNARITGVKMLQNRVGTLAPSDVSRDGQWIALSSILDRQQDIFLMKSDGTGLTRLTDDLARDWSPRFAPDGKSVTFYSNASGKYDGYMIRLDGSGRARLTDIDPGVAFTQFSPDGKKILIVADQTGTAHVAAAGPPWPLTKSSAPPMKGLEVEGGQINPSAWSRGGRWISGYVVDSTGEVAGFGVNDVATGKSHRLNRDSREYDLGWLPDDRHVLYFTTTGVLMMQDVVTLERRPVSGALPYPPDLLGTIAVSWDGRTVYYGARRIEANVWMVRRVQASPR